MILHILEYKLRSFIKLTSELTAANIIKNLGSAIVFGGFTLGAYWFSREITTYMLDKVHVGVFLLHRFLSMVLYVFFLSINIGNIIVSYAALYRSKETHYYLTKPVSYTSLFTVKFLDTFFYSSTTLFLIAIAVLVGYGSRFNMPWFFYLEALLFLFIPFMLLSASLGVIALLLLMRLAKTLGIKFLFLGIVLGYISTIYVYFTVTNPVGLVNSVMKYYPYVDLYFGFLDAKPSHYVPSHWVAEALYWTVRGNHLLALTNTSYLLTATITSVTVMLLLGKYLYYETWLISMDLRASGEARSARLKFYSFSSEPVVLDVQTSALVKKEFWQFFREPSQWIHFGVITMLTFIFVQSIRAIDLNLAQPFLKAVAYLVIYVFNAFLVSSIALRFVYPMISFEGRAFWTIRSAPVTMRRFYWLKFAFSAVPLLAIGISLLVASHQPLRFYQALILTAFGSLIPVMLAFTGLNLSLGSYFSNFRESNPIKIASSQGATLTFLFTIVMLIFLVAVLFFPIEHYFDAFAHGVTAPIHELYVGMLVVAILSLLVLAGSTVIGLRSLRRDL